MSAWGAATVVTGIATVIYLAAGWALKALIENAVKSDFDNKLEVLRADLRAKETEIDALRAGALMTMRDRHANLDKRRLQAVERLWENVSENGNLRFLSTMMQAIKVESMFDAIARGGRDADKIVEWAELLATWGGIDTLKDKKPVHQERPFLSSYVWAVYSAYNFAILHPVAQVLAIRHRQDASMIDSKATLAAIRAALPHQEAYLEKHGANGIPFLVAELEETLLKAIREELNGKDADDRQVQQAAAILKQADHINALGVSAPAPPQGYSSESKNTQG